MARTRIPLAVAALLFGAHWAAQAQWVQIGRGLRGGGSVQTINTPAESGRVTQLARAYDESQKTEILWLGASHGGLWKSFEDKPGHVASWSVVTDNFPGSHTLGSFLIHAFVNPGDSQRILIGTGSAWGDGDGIYASDDGGASWCDASLCPPASGDLLDNTSVKKVWRMAADADDPSGETVLAATDHGIWRSALFGARHASGKSSWTRVFKGQATDLVQHPILPGTWFAGVTKEGVFISTDGGTNWKPYGTGFPEKNDVNRVSLAASSDGRFLFALVVDHNKIMKGVFRVAIQFLGGVPTWTKISTSNQPVTLDPHSDENNPQAFHTCAIGSDPANPAHLVFGLVKMAESFDADADEPTWTNQVDGGHDDYNFFLFGRNRHTIVIGNDGGYYIYDFSSLPATVNDEGNLLGLNSLELSVFSQQGGLAVSRTDPDVFLAGVQDSGVVRGSIAGNEVSIIAGESGSDGHDVSIDPDNADVMAYSTNAKRLFSVDGARVLIGDQTCGGKDNDAALLIDPAPGLSTPVVYTSQSIVAGLNTQVLWENFSDDCNWAPVGPALLSGTITHVDHTADAALHQILVTVQGDPRLFLYFGPRFALGSLPLLTLTPPSIGGEAWVNADRSALQPDTIYYVSGTVGNDTAPPLAFRSAFAGFEWEDLTGDIAPPAPSASALPKGAKLNKLIANPLDTSDLFLATTMGVFRGRVQEGGGVVWQDFSDGLRLHEKVSDLAINVHHGLASPRLVAATQGRGFWTRSLGGSVPHD